MPIQSGAAFRSTDSLDLFKEVLSGAVYDESAWTRVLGEELKPAASWTSRIKYHVLQTIARSLNRSGISLMRRQPFKVEDREIGDDWPALGYTMVGHRRLDNIQQCIETILADGVPGDLIETGVWRGGSCMMMKAVLERHGVHDRTVWLADSFQGLPSPKDKADGWDLSGVEYLSVSADQVRRNFARFGLLDERVRFLEGWFSDTLPKAPIDRLALLRLDGDLYHSTMDALTNLYHRVSPGGFVIVDDYGAWPSCERAVTEFLAARGEKPAIQKIDRAGVYWRLPSH
jgi:O-methyltransferase